MLAVPATKHGTLLHHAVMLQLSDATRALLLAGEFDGSDHNYVIDYDKNDDTG